MTVLWGFDLWDQFDNVDKHFQHGIDFAEKYSKFVKERASIEQDYAGKLRKLVKGYMPRKRDEERNKFSTHKSFQAQLSELNDIAGQHEMVAEEMMGGIAKVCSNHCQEMKMEKKEIVSRRQAHAVKSRVSGTSPGTNQEKVQKCMVGV